MPHAVSYAAKHSFSRLRPMTIQCDDPKAGEVEIEILFCGVCHSDIHQVRNDRENTVHPCLPGHEIVGRVARVGRSDVRFRYVIDIVTLCSEEAEAA